MNIQIPSKNTKRWSGPYLGNYYGDLWKTFNIDLDKDPGHVLLSRKLTKLADTQDTNLLGLDVVDAFLRTNADSLDRWWGLNRNGKLIRTDSVNPLNLLTATWKEDTLAASPSDARDMTVHENDSDSGATGAIVGRNRLFVTRDTDIASLNDTASGAWNSGWWVTTKSQPALKSGVPHPIQYFPFQRITIIGDGNLVHTIDKNRNVSYARLSLPLDFQLWGIFYTPNRAWLCCAGLKGKNGAIIEWDGYSQSYNNIYDAKSNAVLSGVDYNGSPVVLNNRGIFLEYNGYGFIPMYRNGQEISLPIVDEINNSFHVPDMSGGTRGIVAPRGMDVTEEGLIYINIQDPIKSSFRSVAGVWCLNPINGQLYNKYSLNIGDSSDFGHQVIQKPGAIKFVNSHSTLDINTLLLVGGSIQSNYQSEFPSFVWAIHRNYNSSVNRGYLITNFFQSDEIQEMWDVIWMDISKLLSSNDKIIVKARGVNSLLDSSKNPLRKIIEWASATSFSVTLSAGDDALLVGDEIEILSGKNGGTLAHITEISGAHGAAQTITIDETVTNSSGFSLCRFERWKKIGTITDTTKYIIPVNIGITSSFIQFKVELRGIAGDYGVKRLIVKSDNQTKIKK